jgi:acetate kinase
MNILVFNCGSSSLNYKVFEASGSDTLAVSVSGKAHRVGVTGSEPSFIEHRAQGQVRRQVVPIATHVQAAELVLQHLGEQAQTVDVIGHRFVHGGSYFRQSVRLTPETLGRLEACLPLAPIHNPNSLSVIQTCQRLLPAAPQYVTFDTAFHASLPPAAYTYALPPNLVRKYDLRKYGFHGLSYQFVMHEAARFLHRPLNTLSLVACHLGTGGSSVAAIQNGRSLDTSMGYSPLAGLMMSTRTGDLDPFVPLYLMEHAGYSVGALSDLFNKKSGLLGVSGFSSDLRDLIRRRDETGDERAALAIDLYAYRLKKTIGAYAALLHGPDALIFTDDVGVQNWRIRERACQGMEWCGVRLDSGLNRAAPTDRVALLSASDSRVAVLSVPTDEERVIGLEGARLFSETRHADL